MNGFTYQVYLRSFQDSDGDGVGDLNGLRRRLPILADLGVEALWLSPFHPSPDADFGYDVADYDAVDPRYGTLTDFDTLLHEAHQRGIGVWMDGVFNHTSAAHPWFVSSAAGGEHRDWYHWHAGDRPPNNWQSTFRGPAWTFHPGRRAFYLHSFAAAQPDLNWRHPPVADAILASMEGWLARGVDGFRLDVFNCYRKDPALRDNPRRWSLLGLAHGYFAQHHIHDRDQADLAEVLGRMRALADRFGATLVGETLDEQFVYDNAAQWVGPSLLHHAFDFRLLHSRWGAQPFARAIEGTLAGLRPPSQPAWALSNHDFPRAMSRWGDRPDRARLLPLLLCALPGAVFLYQGEELGLSEARLPRAALRDPPGVAHWPFYKGRDGCRTPMPWSEGPQAGFTEGTPWLPIPAAHRPRHQGAQAADPASLWRLHQAALRLRRQSPALREGAMGPVEVWQGDVLRLLRRHPAGDIEALLNLGDRPRPIPAGAAPLLAVGAVEAGQLGPCAGLLRPAGLTV